MDFFDNLSPTTQLILSVVGLLVLFLAAFANNKKNTAKQRNRRRRKFGENLKQKNRENE